MPHQHRGGAARCTSGALPGGPRPGAPGTRPRRPTRGRAAAAPPPAPPAQPAATGLQLKLMSAPALRRRNPPSSAAESTGPPPSSRSSRLRASSATPQPIASNVPASSEHKWVATHSCRVSHHELKLDLQNQTHYTLNWPAAPTHETTIL